jgi:hypothetical protein
MNEISDCYYSVKLVLVGLDHPRSRSKVSVNLRAGDYGSSYFTDHTEELSIEFDRDSYGYRSLSFMDSNLFGFDMGEHGYYYDDGRSIFLTKTSSKICPPFPSGLIICLFIMMVHPARRARFISYLNSMEEYCSSRARH